MSRPLNVSLAQIDITPLAPDSNARRLLDIAQTEAQSGAQLIVFPELSNTGYVEPSVPGGAMPDGLSHACYARRLHDAAATLDGPLVTALSSLAMNYNCHIVVGLALRSPQRSGVLFNASLLLAPDGATAYYAKAHLWHNEKLYFTPGNDFPVIRTVFGMLGMQVCYDIRFPEVTRSLALGGAEVITNVWASFRHADQPISDPDLFRHRAFTRAQENGVFFLSCNRVGRQGTEQFMGRSVIARPDGTIVAALDHEEEDILRCELDLDEVADYRMATGILNDRRPSLYATLSGEERSR